MKSFFTILFSTFFIFQAFSKKSKCIDIDIQNFSGNKYGILSQYVGKSIVPIDTIFFVDGKAKLEIKKLRNNFRYCILFENGKLKYGFDFCGENKSTMINTTFNGVDMVASLTATKGSNTEVAIDILKSNFYIYKNLDTYYSNYYNRKSDSSQKATALTKINLNKIELTTIKQNLQSLYPNNNYANLFRESCKIYDKHINVFGFSDINIDTFYIAGFNPDLILKSKKINLICTPEFYIGLRSFILDINKINKDSITQLLKVYDSKKYLDIPEFKRVMYDVLFSVPYNQFEKTIINFYNNYLLNSDADNYVGVLEKYRFKQIAIVVSALQNGKKAPDVDIRTWGFRNISIDSLPNKKLILYFYDYNKNDDAIFLQGMQRGYKQNVLNIDKTKYFVLLVSIFPDKLKAMEYLTNGNLYIPEWNYGFNTLNNYELRSLYGSDLVKSSKIYFIDEEKTIIDKWDTEEETTTKFFYER